MRPSVVVESRGFGVRPLLAETRLRQLAKITAAIADVREAVELSVAFVPASVSARLNAIYRNKKKVADVLSFPIGRLNRAILGEILLCPSAIRQRAAGSGRSTRSETERLFVHGALHVFGIHHANERAGRRMDALEAKVLTHAAV